MKEIRIKQIEDGMGDILIQYDDYDITIIEEKHEENSITLTRKEMATVIKYLKKITL